MNALLVQTVRIWTKVHTKVLVHFKIARMRTFGSKSNEGAREKLISSSESESLITHQPICYQNKRIFSKGLRYLHKVFQIKWDASSRFGHSSACGSKDSITIGKMRPTLLFGLKIGPHSLVLLPIMYQPHRFYMTECSLSFSACLDKNFKINRIVFFS